MFQKSQFYRWVQDISSHTVRKQPQQKGRIYQIWQEIDCNMSLTMWMRWEILSERVRKGPSYSVPKNLVSHMPCRIKSNNFCPCHRWPFWSDIIAFYDSVESWLDAIWIMILMPSILGYLIPNPLYRCILNICDLVRLSFIAYRPLLVI